MAEWRIQLSGDKFDLDELPRWFTSEELKVKEENGKYYLKSSELNLLTEASKVKEQAEKFLKFINGAGKIKDSKFKPVSIGRIEKAEANGRSMQYLFPESINGRSKVSGDLSVIKAGSSEEEQTTIRISYVESWVTLTSKDKNVAKVLSFFCKELNWQNLYKIWEVIEEEQGSKVFEKGWASEKKISDFTQTANSYLAIGDEARHGYEKIPIPRKSL